MHAPTNLIERAAWLSYAAFWGLAVGLLLLLFNISPTAYGDTVGIASFFPLILVAVAFPLIGAICDRLLSHHLFMAVLTLFISLLFLLDVITGFRLQSHLLLILGLPGLLLGFFVPFTTFAQESFRKTVRKNAMYFVTWSGSLLTLLLVQRAFVDIDSFINFYYTLLIFSGLLACVFFLMQSEYTRGQQHGSWLSMIKEELQKNLSNDRNTHNFRILLGATTLFVAGTWNATRFSLELWHEVTLQNNLIMMPLILLTVLLSSAYTPRLVRSFGPKRHFTASTVLILILGSAQSLASTSVEHYLLLLCHLSILSSNLLNIFSLANWLLPQNRTGQGIAWIAWSLLLGYLFGEGIYDLPSVLNGFAFLSSLVIAGVWIQFFCKSGVKDAFEGDDEGQASQQRGEPLLTWPSDAHTPHVNAQHNLLTSILQSMSRLAAEIFFARIRIVGAHNLKVPNGAILVANHPNTFLDPMLITALSPGRLHYWAKSTLWSLPFLGSILDRMGAIPVYRRQDRHAQDSPNRNSNSLSLAAEKLRNGGWVLIFPEGVSEPGLSLKPLKTGACRLGFEALKKSDWEPATPIIPIGIDYMEPGIFRSNITLRIGSPLELKDYREAYQAQPQATVREVTQALSDQMKHLLPHLNENHLEALVLRIFHLYGERVLDILECDDETEARRKITQAVNHYQQLDADTVCLFSHRLDTYWQEYERLGTPANHDPIHVNEIFKIFVQLHSFAGFGLLTNWIPYKLTGRCVDLLTPSPVWLATAKLTIGGFLFSLYYGLIFALTNFLATPLIGLILMLLVILAGILSLGAMDRFAFRLHQFKTLWQALWTQDTDENLDGMRISLIQDLERFRETYAFYSNTSMDSDDKPSQHAPVAKPDPEQVSSAEPAVPDSPEDEKKQKPEGET